MAFSWIIFSTIGSVPCTPAWVRDAGAKGWQFEYGTPAGCSQLLAAMNRTGKAGGGFAGLLYCSIAMGVVFVHSWQLTATPAVP